MYKKTILAALSLLICFNACAETAKEKEDKKRETIKTHILNFLAGLSIGYAHGNLNTQGADEAATFILANAVQSTFATSNSAFWGHALGQSLAEATKENPLPYNIMWVIALLAGATCTSSSHGEVVIYKCGYQA